MIWREINVFLTALSLFYLGRRRWQYDGLWTDQELAALRSMGVWSLGGLIGAGYLIFTGGPFNPATPLVTIAASFTLYAVLRPPSRFENVTPRLLRVRRPR